MGQTKRKKNKFKEQQNNYISEYHRFDWLTAPYTLNTKVKTLHSITVDTPKNVIVTEGKYSYIV